MKILILEPYFTGSHQDWALGYQAHSNHEVSLLTLPGRFWKWRMHGGAISLAEQFNASDLVPDLIIASSMLDLTTFLSLTRKRTSSIPSAVYFHENQLTYPWSPTDRDLPENRDFHYGFINIASAAAADACYFNSEYHMNSFLEAVPRLINSMPDEKLPTTLEDIGKRSSVLHLGLDLKRFDQYKNDTKGRVPLILWNHRWEYDKNPEGFFNLMFRLSDEGIEFELAILGENFSKAPDIFNEAREKLGDRIIHFGYAESFKDYAELLWKADILPVTNNQDFFGASIMEAVYCNTAPVLPERLTYPELFPENQFYSSEEDLFKKVKTLIESPLRNSEFLNKIAKPYDWATMGPVYDGTFERLISKV